MKMAFGNSLGFRFSDEMTVDDIFGYSYASFLPEVEDAAGRDIVGKITKEQTIGYRGEEIPLDNLLFLYENKLEGVCFCNI